MGYVSADQIFGYKMWLVSGDLKDSNGGRFHNGTVQNDLIDHLHYVWLH